MCGIYGIINYRENGNDIRDLRLMGDVLLHRGPDDRGDYQDDTVLLGHNRLSIIDLSPSGRQPMSNEDGTIWITYNGEIYNFKKLQSNLKRYHVFKSKTDTEVIIHAYEEYGENLWNMLEGMFAFCLWDSRCQTVYMVRDHYGIKPLYYSFMNESLIFSSQIKGILSLRNFDISYNYQSLSNYFSLFYIPGPETVVKNIEQLQAGCFLKYESGASQLIRYHKLNFNINNDYSENQLIEEIPEKIHASVKSSLVSDVPVGLLLSGGIDSNILLTEMSDLYTDKMMTFTLGVEESSYDESNFVKDRLKDFNCEHHINMLHYEDFDNQLTDITCAVDCLNANPGLIMISQFLKLASQYSKVSIMGSGGDELFAGYPTYKADHYLKYFKLFPPYFRNFLLRIFANLPVSYRKYSFDYVLKKFLEGSMYNQEKAHYWWRTIFSDDEKKNLFDADLLKDENIIIDSSYKYSERFNEIDSSFENKALYSDFYLFLGDNALTLADHLSMHYSLEVRPPMLDQNFVDYVLTIPYYFKYNGKTTKYLLKKAYENRLSKELIARKKHGVVAPLGLLFKKKLKSYIQDQLSADNVKRMPFINTNYVHKVLEDHFDGCQDNGYKIWCLLCLSKWNDMFYRDYSKLN